MKISYKLERLDCMHENKTFFLLFFYIIFFNILEKIGYFNTGFVSLHHRFFGRFFFFNFIYIYIYIYILYNWDVPDPIIWVEPILVRPIFDPKETGLRLAQRVGPISAQNKSWANFNPTYFILGELDQARPTHFGLGRHWYGLGTMALHCSCSLNNEDGWAKKKKKEKKIERLTWWWWWCCH
jgi:hypothetical protein